MFPFKKKPKPIPASKEPSAVKQLIHLLLHRLSDKLSRYEQKMSLPAKKGLITLFCLVASIFAMNTLYRGLFIYSTIDPNFLSRSAIHRPLHPRLPDSLMYRRAPHGLQTAPVLPTHHDSITQ